MSCKKTTQERPDESHAALGEASFLTSPARARGPIDALAAHVSARAQAYAVVRSPRELYARSQYALDWRQSVQSPIWEDVRQLGALFGVDLFDMSSLEGAGMDIDQPVVLSIGEHHERDLQLVFKARDVALVTKAIARANEEVKNLGILFQAHISEDGTAALGAARFDSAYTSCVDCGSVVGESLAQDSSFGIFMAQLMREDATLGFYMPPRGDGFADLSRDLARLINDLTGGRQYTEQAAAMRMLAAARGLGVAFQVGEQELVMRAGAALSEQGAREYERVVGVQDEFVPSLFVQDDALFATHASYEPVLAWQAFYALLSSAARQKLEASLEGMVQQYDLSPMRMDTLFFELFGSHMMAMVYADESRSELAGVSPLLMWVMRDDAARERFFEGARKVLGDFVLTSGAHLESPQGKIQRVDFAVPMLALYHRGPRVVVTSSTLSPDYVLTAFDGAPKRSRLPELERQRFDAADIGFLARGERARELIVELEIWERGLAAMTPSRVNAGLKRSQDALLLTVHVPLAGMRKFGAALDSPQRQLGEAKLLTARFMDSAQAYFTSEQRYAQDQPWHAPSAAPSQQVGLPIPWAEYCFPGGKGFSMTSHASIPATPTPMAFRSLPDGAHSGAYVQQVLHKLALESVGAATLWRYTYTTGEECGEGATATFRAERDFDPATPQAHTMEQRVQVDPVTQQVYISPMVTTSEYQ